jgi:hypothetical protein
LAKWEWFGHPLPTWGEWRFDSFDANAKKDLKEQKEAIGQKANLKM